MVAVMLKGIAVVLTALFMYHQYIRLDKALERIRNMEARVFENDDVNIIRLTPRDAEMILDLLSKPPMRPTPELLKAARDYKENIASGSYGGTD